MKEVIKLKERQLSNNQEEKGNLLGRSLFTGFFGGALWSLFGVIMYYFNFAEVSPKTFLLRSWLKTGWTDRWLGDIISILLAGLLSIVVAWTYYAIFKKIYSMWLGIIYGIVLWVIIFVVLQPIFPNVPILADLDGKTIVSTLCLFIIYGLFVGYSISYDYYDTMIRIADREEGKNNA